MSYVIYKSSRLPRKDSYDGPTWQEAGIKDRYKEQYLDRSEAEELVRILSEHNPVGFAVAEVPEG